MARFLLTASGFHASLDGPKLRQALKDQANKAKAVEVKITNIREDKVFTSTGLITVSANTKAGANRVQKVLWDVLGCGSVEIEKLPEKGYGGRRMGAEIPVNSYMD
jgi:hypothetical protein